MSCILLIGFSLIQYSGSVLSVLIDDNYESMYNRLDASRRVEQLPDKISIINRLTGNTAIDLDAILPRWIVPKYQYRTIALSLEVDDESIPWELELIAPTGEIVWKTRHQGVTQDDIRLPAGLGKVNSIKLTFGGFKLPGYRLSLKLRGAYLGRERFFLWCFAHLLSNAIGRNGEVGLVRDKHHDSVGEMDNVPASGMLIAALAVAQHLRFISSDDARELSLKIIDRLLRLPRCHGLFPHFVGQDGEPISEYSSVDTVICLIAAIVGADMLSIDPAPLIRALFAIDWERLILADGTISHGYRRDGERIEVGWDVFGGETWLVNLGYAAVTGRVANVKMPHPPTWNGSGFIDELPWLFMSPPETDIWGNRWNEFRENAARTQLDYYSRINPYEIYSRLGLFGLSAGESPDGKSYRTYGVGGINPAEDGRNDSQPPVIVPHYAAMISSLRPDESTKLFEWLESREILSPMNNPESLSLDVEGELVWNSLKGSWNLSLAVLGLGSSLFEGNNPLHLSFMNVPCLSGGYAKLAIMR